MPQLDPVPVGVVLDSAGDIASGALLKVYTAGTTTPVTTYQDSALSTAHAFPVVASAAGRFSEVYVVAGNYKVDLQDSEGASLPGYPRDNVTIAASGVSTGATYGRSVQLSDDYSDATAWTVESSVGVTARSQAYDSSTQLFDSPYVLELAGDASDATNKVESAASVVTVTPGQAFRVTVPIYATGSPTSTLEVGFEWYNSAGTSLSESARSYQNSDITTGQVLHGTHVATAPSSAALMRVIIQRKTASVTGNWYAGAARLEIGLPLSGADSQVLTGTAGTNGNLAQWNADGDLVDGPDVLDEDDMTTDSETAVPTQQSVKAYVDTEVAAVTSTLATAQATTSTSAWTFASIPAGVNWIDIILNAVSLSGTDDLLIQIGDSGGFETSSYTSTSSLNTTNATSTSGFLITVGSAAITVSGTMHLRRVSGNIWNSNHSVERTGSAASYGGGVKTLSAELTQARLTVSGSDTGDNGSVAIAYGY